MLKLQVYFKGPNYVNHFVVDVHIYYRCAINVEWLQMIARSQLCSKVQPKFNHFRARK